MMLIQSIEGYDYTTQIEEIFYFFISAQRYR